MATLVVILIVLAAVVFAVIVGPVLWGIVTQRRDRPHVFARRRRRRTAAR